MTLRDFRPLRYSSRDGHAEGEHVNRGRDTPIFCPTLQVIDMSTLGDAADVNPVIKFLTHTLHVCRSVCSMYRQARARAHSHTHTHTHTHTYIQSNS